MQNCFQHNKPSIGNCVWCGKDICQSCVGRIDRKKVYCVHCSSELNPIIKDLQFEKLKRDKNTEEEKEKIKYFDFSSVMEK